MNILMKKMVESTVFCTISGGNENLCRFGAKVPLILLFIYLHHCI